MRKTVETRKNPNVGLYSPLVTPSVYSLEMMMEPREIMLHIRLIEILDGCSLAKEMELLNLKSSMMLRIGDFNNDNKLFVFF